LISDKTFRFVFREDNVIDKRYLNHVLKSPALRIQIEQQATGTSPTMKNISKEKVMELKVPCIPLDEQRRIVAYLDGLQAKVNVIRELQSASGEELSALMPSILDKAFKGEL
jgi:type I restriction enzyme S subunit